MANWWDSYVTDTPSYLDSNMTGGASSFYDPTQTASYYDPSQTAQTSNWWDTVDPYQGMTTDPVQGTNDYSWLYSPQYTDSSVSQNWQTAPTSNWLSTALNGLTSPAGLSTIAGGLLGGVNGSKQTGTQTNTQAPWTPQQPYLLDMFSKAKTASDSGAMSPYEQSALTGMQNFASGPKTNPYAGVDNPYLTQSINNASQDAMRNLMPMYDQAQRASGSFGNSGVTEAFGRTAADTLGKIATNARMQDYGTQQQLGENAVNRTVSSLGPLFSAGQNSASNPWTNINKYGQAITGSYGGTSSQPIYTNQAANVLGGGLLGSQIYKNLGL